MARKKLRKSLWVPAALALYCGAMSWYFGRRLRAEGLAYKLWLSVAFEAVVIIGLFFALSRKEKLHEAWPEDKK